MKNKFDIMSNPEERFRTMADNISDGLIIIENGKVVYVNSRAEEIFGYPFEKLKDMNGIELALPDERDRLERIIAEHKLKETLPDELSFWIMAGDGKKKYINNRYSLHKIDNRPAGRYVVTTDITQTRLFQEKIIESEKRFREMADLLPQVVFETDNLGRLTYMNRYGCEISGHTEDELKGKSVLDLLVPEQRQMAVVNMQLSAQGKKIGASEYTVSVKNGLIPVLIYSSPIKTSEGFAGFRGVIVVISELKEKERELKRFKFILDRAGEEFYLVRRDGSLVYVNESAASSLGYSVPELLELGVPGIDPEYSSEKYKIHFDHLKTVDLPLFETVHINKDGRHIPKEIKSVYISLDGEEYVVGFGRDITKRKQAEKALHDEKELLAVTLESIGDAVVSSGMDDRIILMNRAASEIFETDIESARGLPLENVIDAYNNETREKIQVTQVFRYDVCGSGSRSDRLLIKTISGNERIVFCVSSPLCDSNKSVIGIVYVFRDITRQLIIEREINKIQKLESLGLLAGGIAHDFNNILTAIVGNISILRSGTSQFQTAEVLSEAESAAFRARDLTRQLLTFSKGGDPIKESSTIQELIVESASFILRGANTKAIYEFEDDLPTADIDRGQISQVIQNLIINADQAMPDGGEIIIRASRFTNPPPSVLPVPPGSYIVIEVHDTGVGIPPDYIDRIFDPYFTTKQKGSGLGLAVSFSIIKKHGGHIEVKSDSGDGTRFRVYLPAGIGMKAVERSVEENKAVLVSGEKVLIMDDENGILKVSVKMLEMLGYEADSCFEGESAVAMYSKALLDGNPYSAVILDLTIPGGMGGKEAAAKILESDPKAVIIVASGYSNDPIMSDHQSKGIAGKILKPYGINELGSVLSKAMNRSGV